MGCNIAMGSVNKTPNPKHQISNKSQIPISNYQMFGFLNLGHCDLFDICYLLFGIWNSIRWTPCYITPYLLEQFIDCPFFEEITPV